MSTESRRGAPGNQRAAVEQHAEGHAEHWDACTGCGVSAGEPCVSLSGQPGVRRGERSPNPPRKKRPCAARTFRCRS